MTSLLLSSLFWGFEVIRCLCASVKALITITMNSEYRESGLAHCISTFSNTTEIHIHMFLDKTLKETRMHCGNSDTKCSATDEEKRKWRSSDDYCNADQSYD